MRSFLCLSLWGLVPLVASHGMLTWPPSIRDTHNPHSKGNAYYDNNKPLARDGSDFPCGAGFKDLDSEYGKPVATWSRGESYNMTATITAWHDGGSCQMAMSADQGKNWKVIQSDVGNCPPKNGDTNYDFTLPKDAPLGEKILFSWAWLPNEGLREMFHSCAVVTIKESGGQPGLKNVKGGKKAVTWANATRMFEANIGREWCTVAGKDPVYLDPGTVVNYAVGKDKLIKPVKGKCPEDQATAMLERSDLQVTQLPQGGESSEMEVSTTDKSQDLTGKDQGSLQESETSPKNSLAPPSPSDKGVLGAGNETQNGNTPVVQNDKNDINEKQNTLNDFDSFGGSTGPSSDGGVESPLSRSARQTGQDGGLGGDVGSGLDTKKPIQAPLGRKGRCGSMRRRRR